MSMAGVPVPEHRVCVNTLRLVLAQHPKPMPRRPNREALRRQQRLSRRANR